MTENLRECRVRTPGRASLHLPSRDRYGLYRRLSVVLLMIVITVVIFGYFNFDDEGSFARFIWFITGAGGLFITWLMKQILKLDWLAPPIVYALVFWVFHFGLLFPASISLNILDTIDPWTRAWIYQSDTLRALFAALLFLASFSVGTLLLYKDIPTLLRHSKEDKSPELVAMGWVLIGMSILLVLIAIINFSWRVFLASYQEFFVIHNSFSWAIVIMATGIMLQIAGGRENKSVLKSLVFLFLPLIIPVMIAGSRTAPVFTSVAIMSVLSLRGLRIPLKVLIPGVVLVLILMATVKDVRQQGITAVIEQSIQVETQDPLSGLTELGFSLRPVTASIDYIRNRGEFFYGQTYYFPFIRQVQRFTGLREASITDERFIGNTITRIYGASGGGGLGFSVVAEAYVNGGMLAIVLFGFGWGMLLSGLTVRATTPYRLAVLAAIMIPMLINVRNSFIYVPAWIFLGALTIVAARVLRKQYRRKPA
jgi:hypothetical protein